MRAGSSPAAAPRNLRVSPVAKQGEIIPSAQVVFLVIMSMTYFNILQVLIVQILKQVRTPLTRSSSLHNLSNTICVLNTLTCPTVSKLKTCFPLLDYTTTISTTTTTVANMHDIVVFSVPVKNAPLSDVS